MKEQCMWLIFKPSRRGSGPGAKRVLGIGSLCTLILCGYALAQKQPPAKSSADHKAEAQTPAKAETRSGANSDTKAGSDARPAPRRSTITVPKTEARGKARQAPPRRAPARGASNWKMDPDAKLVCETRTVTLDPLWRNGKDLTFPFKIRNDGTADLRIQAKGG